MRSRRRSWWATSLALGSLLVSGCRRPGLVIAAPHSTWDARTGETVGVDLDEAQIFVEPANTLGYAASGAKRDGILKLPKRALHVELRRAARTQWRELYVAILADFLLQAVPLPAER